MNDQSTSATGICPYPDCGATITLGKKFCKTCGRAVQSAMASPPRSAAREEQALPTPEPVTATKSVNEPVDYQDLQAEPVPPNSECTDESPRSAQDAPVELPRPIPIQPGRPETSQRPLIAGGIAVLTLLAVSGYWFMKPKTIRVVAMDGQGPVTLPTNTSLPPPTRQAETQRPTAAKQTPDAQLVQHDDALRRERELITAERSRLEQLQEETRKQELQHQQELAQRQEEAESQRRALAELNAKQAELKAKQEEQQRQIDEKQKKLVEDKPPPPPPKPDPISPPVPRGPSSGEIVWEGTIKGTELITIENGQSSSGTVLGALPGVAVLIQPTDTKKVSIASSPGPRNQYNRLVLRVSGNGNTRVILKWSLP